MSESTKRPARLEPYYSVYTLSLPGFGFGEPISPAPDPDYRDCPRIRIDRDSPTKLLANNK
jgi:hypothetical protein